MALMCTRCYFCWVRDCSETHSGELYCYKHGRYIIGNELERIKSEECADYRDDAIFRRLDYPVGVTPEDAEEQRKAELLKKLREE